MPSSVGDKILDDVAGIVQGLGLAGVVSGKVAKRMLPKAGPFDATIDGDPPWIFVSPGPEPVTIEGIGFEAIETGYPVEIAIVYPNNRDFVTQLAQFEEWRSRVADYFGSEVDMPTAAEVVDVQVMPQSFFDRGLLSQNYGYVSVPVLFVASRQRR
jgi:hypothetical protein